MKYIKTVVFCAFATLCRIVTADSCSPSCCSANQYYDSTSSACVSCPSDYAYSEGGSCNEESDAPYCERQSISFCYKKCDESIPNIQFTEITITIAGSNGVKHYDATDECKYILKGSVCSSGCCKLSCAALPGTGLPGNPANATGAGGEFSVSGNDITDESEITINYSNCYFTDSTSDATATIRYIYTTDGNGGYKWTKSAITCKGGYYLASDSDAQCSPVGRGYYSNKCDNGRTACSSHGIYHTDPTKADKSDSVCDCNRKYVTFGDNRGTFQLNNDVTPNGEYTTCIQSQQNAVACQNSTANNQNVALCATNNMSQRTD